LRCPALWLSKLFKENSLLKCFHKQFRCCFSVFQIGCQNL
jgi:hypothetical protein